MKNRRMSLPLSLFLYGAFLAVGVFSFFLVFERLPWLLEGNMRGVFAFLTGISPVPVRAEAEDESLPEEGGDEEKLLIFLPDEGAIPGIVLREERSPDGSGSESTKADEPLPDNAEPVKALTIKTSLAPKNNPDLSFDVEELLDTDPVFDRRKDAILIVHTHGCESYSLSPKAFVADNSDARTRDPEKNVVAVGDVLEEELEKRGFRVIHDRTMCDEAGFNTAYKTALGVIEREMAKDPSIAMVLDIHRDSLSSSDGTRYKLLSGDGKSSQIMFVVGSGALLSHPGWRSNLAFALHLEKKASELYEDLARPVTISKNRYNQHVTPLSLIVECGTEANTLSEAKEAVRRLALILDGVLPPA